MENKLNIEILINNAGMFFQGNCRNIRELVHKITQLHVSTPTLLVFIFQEIYERKTIRTHSFYIIYHRRMSFQELYYMRLQGYIRQFARSLRYEMNDYHVNVTVVCPLP